MYMHVVVVVILIINVLLFVKLCKAVVKPNKAILI